MSDQELVALVVSFLAKGSAGATAEECRAWDEFHRRYTRISRAKIGTRQGWVDSDDLVQLIGIILIHRLRTSYFDPARSSLDVWIATVVRDVVRRHTHRFSKRREQPITPEMADELLNPGNGPDIEVERLILREKLADLIEGLRAKLSQRDHRIVIKRWVEDRPVSEIADECKVTDDCVTSVLYRVSLKLRERLRAKDWVLSEKDVG